MHARPRQEGISLTELMVVSAIGLFVLAAIGQVGLSSRTTFRTVDALARMQENARYAFETMAHDIRMTGFTGGPSDGGSPVNVVNNPDPQGLDPWDPKLKGLYVTSPTSGPMVGYEAGVSTFPLGVQGRSGLTGDALTIVRADTEAELSLIEHNEISATLMLDTCPSDAPGAGEIVVLSDHTHSSVFQIGSASCAAGKLTLGYTAGQPPYPGNVTSTLGPFLGAIGARKLYRLSGVTYFVAHRISVQPAVSVLYRLRLGFENTNNGPRAKAIPEEIIENVEDMQIEYGEDTNVEVPPVWEVNAYRTAQNVINWDKVLSVRIRLTLVSRVGERLFEFETGDQRLRKTLTQTISIRNRLL